MSRKWVKSLNPQHGGRTIHDENQEVLPTTRPYLASTMAEIGQSGPPSTFRQCFDQTHPPKEKIRQSHHSCNGEDGHGGDPPVRGCQANDDEGAREGQSNAGECLLDDPFLQVSKTSPRWGTGRGIKGKRSLHATEVNVEASRRIFQDRTGQDKVRQNRKGKERI